MIFRYVLAALLLATPAYAQKTKAELNSEIATSFPNNNSGTITPSVLRKVTGDIVSAIMPTAPVAAGNLACFNGVTGLLKDCGAAPGITLTVGTTLIVGGTSNTLLYNNAGVLGNLATIPNSMLAQMPAYTIKCNPTVATANAQDCANIVLSLSSPVTAAPTTNILFSNATQPTVINASAELDHIRVSQPAGGFNQYTIGANSLVSSLMFQMESLSGSSSSSNMYGVIGDVRNDGPGNVKGVYGRAVLAPGSTGVGVGLVSGITTSSTASTAYGIQISGDTYTNAGAIPVTAGIRFGPNDGVSAVKVTNGVLFDQLTAIQSGGSALRAFANGAGDFATLVNAAGSANLFQVTADGNVGVGVAAGTFLGGENLSVKGFAVIGSSGGPQGIYGNTGSGNLVMGTASNHAVDFRVNNATVATFNADKSIALTGTLKLPVVTIATLPTCNSGLKGGMYAVSDATSPTYNGALTGSGTVSIPVYCNGSAWTAH